MWSGWSFRYPESHAGVARRARHRSRSLIVAALEEAAAILERHGGEAIAPDIASREGALPQFLRRRILRQFRFDAGMHVDGVDALSVAGVSEADRQLARVILDLPTPSVSGLSQALASTTASLVERYSST